MSEMSSIVEFLVRRRLEAQDEPGAYDVGRLPGRVASWLSYRESGKRVFDLAAGLFMLIFFLPTILLLGFVVALDGGRPFISLQRVGRNGRHFACWKVRTMVVDAEARLAHILATDSEAADEWARDCKLSNDPRVTWLGRALRSTSLDELPQLWNVVRGDMSLVGPRPITDAELARYDEAAEAYASVRPGLTGLWQVQGRNAVSYDERVRLDMAYIGRLSLKEDVKILLLTVGAVLNRTGR